MVRPLSSSLSGITSSFKLLDTTAGNIANCRTNGYKAKSVSFAESPSGGVTTTASADGSRGPVFEVDGRMFEGSNVLLASEMINLITARHMFSVNAAAFRTGAEMEKSIVDLFA
jgi:flagellar hook protein FlgE